MKTSHIILAVVAVFLALGVVGGSLLVILGRARSGGATPLEESSGGRAPAPLPQDAIVLTASDGAEVVAPFLLHDEAGAVGGIAAFQPKGSRTEEHKGRVKFTATATGAGTYAAWIHAKWRDTCSNSCGLKVGNGIEVTVGNDDVFSVWHWVPAGKHALESGENSVAVIEREDGVYIDQVLFTQDTAYMPTGGITTAGVLRDIRRFADTFTRSPGHGNEGWEFEGKGKMEVAFSFDPNRIPNQYALTGDAANGPAYAFVKGAPWYGCKVSFSFQPSSDGKYGCIVDKTGDASLLVGLEIKDGVASAYLEGAGVQARAALKDNLRLNQWHRVIIERWAWVTRVWIDEREVLAHFEATPKSGRAGLFVTSGTAVFDDFEIEEIPWQGDDGDAFKIDWTQLDDAKWFRTPQEKGSVLSGKQGAIKAGLGGIPLEEIVVESGSFNQETKQSDPRMCQISAPGLKEEPLGGLKSVQTLRLPRLADGSCTHATFTANLKDSPTGFRRVALRYGRRVPATFAVGPYTFAESEMEDPSDYLDFTEEEYRQMERSPERSKLQRQAKVKPLIGHGSEDDEGPWTYMGGSWHVDGREGCLKGRGSNARLMHAQEICSDMELRFKIRLADGRSAAEVELYAGADPGLRVRFAPETLQTGATSQVAGPALKLDVAADSKWHEVSLRVDDSILFAKVDSAPLKEVAFKRGDGDRIYLKIMQGAADFDDVEFIAQRLTERSALYAFNQPECDWWREPSEHFVDHGGIACVLASSWISLVAPGSKATMWNKRPVNSDAMVAFNVEENTEWYGWNRYPSHKHFPFDHIETTLASEKDPSVCYTLEVNAEHHSTTLLFRNGKEVARVRQDRSFPMIYVGSHMPFLPRVNRVCLAKRGGLLRGIVNGREVIRFNDPAPLEVSRVGLGGHDTRINFSHVEIMGLKE